MAGLLLALLITLIIKCISTKPHYNVQLGLADNRIKLFNLKSSVKNFNGLKVRNLLQIHCRLKC